MSVPPPCSYFSALPGDGRAKSRAKLDSAPWRGKKRGRDRVAASRLSASPNRKIKQAVGRASTPPPCSYFSALPGDGRAKSRAKLDSAPWREKKRGRDRVAASRLSASPNRKIKTGCRSCKHASTLFLFFCSAHCPVKWEDARQLVCLAFIMKKFIQKR